MAAWEMADGTEIRYKGAGLEPAALRKFVVRFMNAQGSFWDAIHWSEHALAVAFKKRFAERVDVRRKQRRPVLAIRDPATPRRFA